MTILNDTVAAALNNCRFSFCDNQLLIANEVIERRWEWCNGSLFATSLRDLRSGREWLTKTPTISSLSRPSGVDEGDAQPPVVTWRTGRESPVEAESLVVELTSNTPAGPIVRRFQIFANVPAVVVRLVMPALDMPALDARAKTAGEASRVDSALPLPTGIETTPVSAPHGEDARPGDVIESLVIDPTHRRLIAVELLDQTDSHNELAHECEWLLHPAERRIEARGSLFFLEDALTGDGLILLKHAPMPHARPAPCPLDLTLATADLLLLGHGLDHTGGDGYPASIIAYQGGRVGRIAALQGLQRQLREYDPQRDGLFLSNTWGDRSRDAAINEAFMLKEVAAGQRLGADVIQIDDGWQRGRTANSAEKGGVWNGFWASDDRFWDVNAARFPHDLEPVVEAARRDSMRFGLWFAPDSSDDFANWQRDAHQILTLHHRYGVEFFKIDGVKVHTRKGEANLRRFFHHVLDASNGKIVFDLDVTAETRPGYFGLMRVGPIFVENRYTDWRRYWPHATLRNLWTLAQYVDPMRLRMEFLNNVRNHVKYVDDPLAPGRYQPDYLFATVMMANPLGWFEMSNLPEQYIEQVGSLAAVWKQHRQAMFDGPIVPIGARPDGVAWTGFIAGGGYGQQSRERYLLMFRELNPSDECSLELQGVEQGAWRAERLAGDGEVHCDRGRCTVRIDSPLRFWFGKLIGE